MTFIYMHFQTKSLLNIIEPSLVEEAFEFLDQIRVPQNPSRILTLATRCYSTYNIAGYLSPETALDMELMSPDIPNMSWVGKSESELEPTGIGAIITKPKDLDVLEGQENSIYRPTDEPEPWELIQLNVQASVMCLSSKVKSFCSRTEKSDISCEKTVCCEVTNDNHLKPQRTTNSSVDETKEESCAVKMEIERSSPVKKTPPSEAQNISALPTALENQTMISSSAGSDSSRSASSGLGVARTNESQLSSCTATPDVSPCEEDSGIGLERIPGETEKIDCISEGGLSVEDEKRDDLLPLDKVEGKQREDITQNVESRYSNDVGAMKAGKLESIMEQSVEDLGTSSENDIKSDVKRENNITEHDSKEGTRDESDTKQLLSENIKINVINDSHCEASTVNEKEHAKVTSRSNDNKKITSTNSATLLTNNNDHIDWIGEVRPSMKKLRQAMDGLMRTARLVHSVFRLQQTPEAAQQAHIIKYRRDICFSQALTSLVTSLMTRLWCRKADPLFLTILAHLGPLAEFESLVSCHGNDAGMLSDMVVAVEDLGAVEFVMVSSCGPHVGGRTRSDGAAPPPATYDLPTPCVSGNRSNLRVVLPVPEHLLSLLPSQNSQQPNDPPSFCVTPVLFNIGINEEASIAEKLGTDGPQTRNNLDSFERISQYYHRFKKLPLPQENSRRLPNMSNEVPLMDLIDKLGQEIQSQRSKNPNVLLLASQCCRAMAGLRFISCKSAKDRTGMAATLEQCNILAAEYDLSETESQRALNCMRSEGTRLENCFKSIGVRRYAFNALQLKMFPKQYRPPSGTYGTAQT
ncbi:Type I inositol 3,4-bisphosphate 4-phosphatase [Halocaridina rubra]|uniref:Type I inositol 3,4-bisphosphate 4-phosphatase n=1 Tax=Halocaridina rubra TaxID=373956 RepID=A0AAN8WXI5_HALRR